VAKRELVTRTRQSRIVKVFFIRVLLYRVPPTRWEDIYLSIG
jgi:hypothetical protein